ncbi:hypothetical protein [Shewanella sp. LZH-2]|uniref:hypothetical protein n=1 Tax=Shewanella sp. LZH-2 TaxID=2806008 RepID=UPI00193D65BA|nr:hypothetical protein [Shewanella sp. LZH-2]QRK79163.1 hypothetical protein JM642_18145 [Shewanella sp. LZH-2]
MTLDIRGSKKTTGISDNQFVVFEELLSNAIDSYLIRKHSSNDISALNVNFEIELYGNDLFLEESFGLKITCTDNGAGMADQQVKAFVTKDSTFKDDLRINGIGKCFGSGRVQYFHFFDRIKIRSIFEKGHSLLLRTLDVESNTNEISETSFITTEADSSTLETSISLIGLSNDAMRKHFASKSLSSEFSAENIKRHILITFLQRFIALKDIIGDFLIEIVFSINGSDKKIAVINSFDLPNRLPVEKIPIYCLHGIDAKLPEYYLNVSTYEFSENEYPSFVHDVALCANSSIVKYLTNTYLKVKKDRTRAINNKFYLILVESDYLERKVNVRRDNFDIRTSCRHSDMISIEPSIEDIIDSLEDYVLSILTPTDFDRELLIKETGVKFGISPSMLLDTRVKVKYGDTADMIAKRVLKKYQEEIVNDTESIFDMKQKLIELDPRNSDFRDSVNAMSWKYTSTIKKMDMANLSQLVVRRSAMLEVLTCAIKGELSVQDSKSGRNENEKLIHNIFFPTGKDSKDIIDHDIWILNEEYHYFEHIASDKALASIPWNESDKLFDVNIDSELEVLFNKNNSENRLKRPDIAIFNQEGSAIIIEFKAPGVELQEHTNDLVQYARLLAAKSKGRIRKFYGYLIGDKIDESRMPPAYTKFASGNGYFNTDRINDFSSGIQYGELYSEILFYKDFVDRAEQRLKIYKEKLGI